MSLVSRNSVKGLPAGATQGLYRYAECHSEETAVAIIPFLDKGL